MCLLRRPGVEVRRSIHRHSHIHRFSQDSRFKIKTAQRGDTPRTRNPGYTTTDPFVIVRTCPNLKPRGSPLPPPARAQAPNPRTRLQHVWGRRLATPLMRGNATAQPGGRAPPHHTRMPLAKRARRSRQAPSHTRSAARDRAANLRYSHPSASHTCPRAPQQILHQGLPNMPARLH